MSAIAARLAILSCLAVSAGAAQADYVLIESPRSVEDTIDKLKAAVKNAGATIFVRVDHGGGAKKVEMALPQAELLIFGNPKLGTPALQADIRAGVQLPLRVLAYEDAEGQVWVTYEDPIAMLGGLDVPADAPYLAAMSGALEKLTAAATAE